MIAYEDGAVDPATWNAHRETMRLKKEFARHFEEHLLAPVFTAELRLFGTLASGGECSPLSHNRTRNYTTNMAHTCCHSLSLLSLCPRTRFS